MLNNLTKSPKKIIKFFSENLLNKTSKIVVYFVLSVYWAVIIAGTVLQIN